MSELEFLLDILDKKKDELEEDLCSDQIISMEHYNQSFGAYNMICKIFNEYQRFLIGGLING